MAPLLPSPNHPSFQHSSQVLRTTRVHAKINHPELLRLTTTMHRCQQFHEVAGLFLSHTRQTQGQLAVQCFRRTKQGDLSG